MRVTRVGAGEAPTARLDHVRFRSSFRRSSGRAASVIAGDLEQLGFVARDAGDLRVAPGLERPSVLDALGSLYERRHTDDRTRLNRMTEYAELGRLPRAADLLASPAP